MAAPILVRKRGGAAISLCYFGCWRSSASLSLTPSQRIGASTAAGKFMRRAYIDGEEGPWANRSNSRSLRRRQFIGASDVLDPRKSWPQWPHDLNLLDFSDVPVPWLPYRPVDPLFIFARPFSLSLSTSQHRNTLFGTSPRSSLTANLKASFYQGMFLVLLHDLRQFYI